jgi:hypothetical protein
VFDPEYKVSAFTPDTAITMTRAELQLRKAPGRCPVPGRLRVTDGTQSVFLTVNADYVDSGPLAVEFAAGTPLAVYISKAAACAKDQGPADGNLVVQYRARQ